MDRVAHVAVYLVAVAVLLVTAVKVWQRRGIRAVTATSLVVAVVGAAWWSVGDAVIAARPGAPLAGIAALATFPGIATLVAGFACLGRSVSGADWYPSRRVIAWLAVEPVLVTVVAATNPWHLLLYSGPGAASLSDPNRWEHGPLFWAHTAYSFLVLAAALAMVTVGWRRTPPVFRRQQQSLVVASLIPILLTSLNLVGRTGDFGDPTPVGFALTCGIMAYAVLRQGLLGLAPVARDVLFAQISEAVVALSPDNRLIDVNPAGEALLRFVDPGGPGPGVVVGQDLSGILRSHRGITVDAGPIEGSTFVRLDAGGREIELEVREQPLRDHRGRSLGRVLVARDVTELNAQRRQLLEQIATIESLRHVLVEQATRDPLTNLHNRRYVMDRLVELVAGATAGAPVCVLMLDIDGFKRINDGFGHAVGDAVLIGMAQRMRDAAPRGALVSRWGGDELVMVLPATGAAVGETVAEEIRARCAAEDLDVAGVGVRWTVSVGVAQAPDCGATAAELLEAADQALYDAKTAGRDTVRRCSLRSPD